jgi:hypothetical protein
MARARHEARKSNEKRVQNNSRETTSDGKGNINMNLEETDKQKD